MFLDTGFIKALIDSKDPYHDTAVKIKKYIDNRNEYTVINTTVFVEVLNKSIKIKISLKELFNDLQNNNEIVELTNEDYLKSLEISGWFGDSINFSDCTIVESMIKMNIRNIVTFDRDFKKISYINVIDDV